MTCHLVCIAKDEDPYIAEWVRYHRKLGFDEIHVYQNGWTWRGPEPGVDLTDWPGGAVQMSAYNDFLRRTRPGDGWAAFLDVDEFLVTPGFSDVHEWLAGYAKCAVVAPNWVFFGSPDPPPGDGVLRRFTWRQELPNRHVKSVVNLSSSPSLVFKGNIHNLYASYRHDVTRSPSGGFVHGPWHDTLEMPECFIAHYYCKSWPEYVERRSRIGVDGVMRPPVRETFDECNGGSVEDTRLRDFLYSG